MNDETKLPKLADDPAMIAGVFLMPSWSRRGGQGNVGGMIGELSNNLSGQIVLIINGYESRRDKMAKRIKDRIPEEFYKGERQPTAYTVKKLIQELQRLPENLRVETSFSGGVRITVFNIDDPETRHLEFEETDS